MEEHGAKSKTLVGVVASAKMTKTVTVEVTTFKRHPLYHKRYRSTKRYLSDTGSVSPQVGDTVSIAASRPLSKLKRWVVTEIVGSLAVAERKLPAKRPAKSTKRTTKE